MSEQELSECKRRVVVLHKEWKTAVAASDTKLAESLDTQCRDLRTRIIAFKRGDGRVQ